MCPRLASALRFAPEGDAQQGNREEHGDAGASRVAIPMRVQDPRQQCVDRVALVRPCDNPARAG